MKLANKTLANRFNLYTIIAVYFLILVGGIVRSTGAGMGCPDWPKCFGGYIPPADISNLPENYEDVYVESRIIKNQRLAKVLNAIGFVKLADRVVNDPLTIKRTSYDPVKAWIEYVNRLIGVVIGLLVIVNMAFAFAYSRKSRWIPILGVLCFLLVVFQGWVGSLVVSTNLLPGFITFHMLLALLLVALLLTQRYRMVDYHEPVKGKWLITLILFLFTVQVIFGTQVREQIDVLHALGVAKVDWIGRLGSLFYIHRSYSLLLLLLIGWLMYRNFKEKVKNNALAALVGIVVLEILFGIIIVHFDVPAFAQPAHLFLGSLAHGVLFYLFLVSKLNKEIA